MTEDVRSPLRRDARRNQERLVAAAEAFRERGLQVPLEEIAQRAGVSAGTLGLVDRAQQAGALRADFSTADLAYVFWSISTIVRATATAAPQTWRRALAMTLDGLRAGAAHPLPEPPLTPAQIHNAMLGLGERRSH